ncbi:VWA domain-containing protein [Bacillus atrophaeus]|uniref:VWA domain-containing protein n=1 Tax=Bacillus atrophaeus TaxID=1452 RepID=UPI002E1C142A|nr:VWA domain-containing protein [Bacillus atrophaeus]
MDKLEEVKKFDITIFTSWLKKYAECGEGLEKAWHFLIEQAELAEKRQEIIEENKRQQDITVNQFRQAREEIQRLNQENGRFKKALQIYAVENNYRRTLRFGHFNPSFMEVDRGQTAREALEGDAE